MHKFSAEYTVFDEFTNIFSWKFVHLILLRNYETKIASTL